MLIYVRFMRLKACYENIFTLDFLHIRVNGTVSMLLNFQIQFVTLVVVIATPLWIVVFFIFFYLFFLYTLRTTNMYVVQISEAMEYMVYSRLYVCVRLCILARVLSWARRICEKFS